MDGGLRRDGTRPHHRVAVLTRTVTPVVLVTLDNRLRREHGPAMRAAGWPCLGRTAPVPYPRCTRAAAAPGLRPSARMALPRDDGLGAPVVAHMIVPGLRRAAHSSIPVRGQTIYPACLPSSPANRFEVWNRVSSSNRRVDGAGQTHRSAPTTVCTILHKATPLDRTLDLTPTRRRPNAGSPSAPVDQSCSRPRIPLLSPRPPEREALGRVSAYLRRAGNEVEATRAAASALPPGSPGGSRPARCRPSRPHESLRSPPPSATA